MKRMHLILWGIVFMIGCYWLYLAFVTHPIVVYDAKSFEDFGKMIYEKGWKQYFLSGPNREPFYPFLIATSMQMAGNGDYVDVLRFFQLGLLILSGLLFLQVLRKSGIDDKIMCWALLYFGVSPALVNSSLSLFSEGVTYSFILGIILTASTAWNSFSQASRMKMVFLGLGFGISFVFLTMTKGIYEMIFPMLLVPFIVLSVGAWVKQNSRVLRNLMIFLTVAVIVFMSCLVGYKSLNKKYNGLFVLTDRASWAFYGAAARRELPLNLQKFTAAVTYAFFEEEGCRIFSSAKECAAWDVRTAEQLGAQKNYEVMARFPPQDQNAQLFKAALREISRNPLQYVLLTAKEWVHMFFWETTQIGFVVYPDWLTAIYHNSPLTKALRFIVGSLSLGAVLLALGVLWRRKDSLWFPDSQNERLTPILFFAVYGVICHVTLYSLFTIIPRHAVPIGPVFIAVIALNSHIVYKKILAEREKSGS